MTREETNKLWKLAENLFPPPRNVDVDSRKYAWYLAFQDYDYYTLRDVMLNLGRTQRFWPDVSEISALLPEKANIKVPVEDYEMVIRQYARLVGAEQPPYDYTPQQLRAWFEHQRDIDRAEVQYEQVSQ